MQRSPDDAPDASRLRERRVSSRMSQDQLAGQAGVTKLTVQNLESGRSKGSPLTWRALAAALSTTVADLRSIDAAVEPEPAQQAS